MCKYVSFSEFVMNPAGKSKICILHEFIQHTERVQPKYEFHDLENASTPYSATVIIRDKDGNDIKYGTGYGASKKHAKLAAAHETLKILIPDYVAHEDMQQKKAKESAKSAPPVVPMQQQVTDSCCDKSHPVMEPAIVDRPPIEYRKRSSRGGVADKKLDGSKRGSNCDKRDTNCDDRGADIGSRRDTNKRRGGGCEESDQSTKRSKGSRSPATEAIQASNQVKDVNPDDCGGVITGKCDEKVNEEPSLNEHPVLNELLPLCNQERLLESCPRTETEPLQCQQTPESDLSVPDDKATKVVELVPPPVQGSPPPIQAVSQSKNATGSATVSKTRFGTELDNQVDEFSLFDNLKITDRTVAQFCATAGQYSPYQILVECLKRNHGLGDTDIDFKQVYDPNDNRKSTSAAKNTFIMTAGKHTVTVS